VSRINLQGRVILLSICALLASCGGGSGSQSPPIPPGDTTAPSAPAGLTASIVSSTQIDLTWSASTDNVSVAGYRLERCQGAGCTNFAQIGAPSGATWSDATLSPATAYSYRVRAADAAGNLSGYSNVASATTSAMPDTTPPSAPSNLASTALMTQIVLSWTASTDNVAVTGYQVERCQGTPCTVFAQIATSSSTTYTDSGLASGTTYSYRVRATDAAGNLSAYSAITEASTPAPPSAPSNLTSTAATTQIVLSWTASTDNLGVTGYQVERCQGAPCTVFAQIATSNSTTYTDSGLASATAYSYRVRATDSAGNLSAYSAITSASTPAPSDTTPPSVPGNLTGTVVSSTRVNLFWSASSDNVGVAGYRVERCQGTGCTNFAQIAAPSTTTWSDSGLTAATAYLYRVRAADAAGNLSAYSTLVPITTMNAAAVTITPARGGLTIAQVLPLSATVSNDVGSAGVTWSASAGSFTAQSTSAATFVAPNSAGQVTITATSIADSSKSTTATLGITDLAVVGTYHNDNARDGANSQEYALTTANVNTASFGKLFSCQVDGAIYAQPLWVSNLSINGVAHNVIIVATQHDSVYAFDADTSPCTVLWQASLLDANHGATPNETSVPSGGTNSLVGSGYGDVKPEIGVTGTPVIDPATNTIYLVSKSCVANALPIYQRLHGLSLIDGTEVSGGPAVIDSTIYVSGTAPDANLSSQVAFNTQTEFQRPGLTLVNGTVYVAWGSHEDTDPYHGWVMGFNEATLALWPNAVFNSTPNTLTGYAYSRGGIWMSGGAPAVDAAGNLYFSTGNGVFDANNAGQNFGDTTLKLSTASNSLTVGDWFTPADESQLDGADTDHGSGGAALLMNTSNGGYVVAAGKEGTVYVLSQAGLGGFTAGNSAVHYEFSLGHGLFSTAGFWNNTLYAAGANSGLQTYTFDPVAGTFAIGASSISQHVYGWPGASPAISASGTTNGVAWAIDSHPYCTQQSSMCGPAVLYAMDATNLTTELWNSSTVAADQAGNAVKFTVPTVANGKVYVGTRGNDIGTGTATVLGELEVYGLKPN
jgi:fibronectin type 3 domain-containing protein